MADVLDLTPEIQKILSNPPAIRELDAELDRGISGLNGLRTWRAHVKAAVTTIADETGPAKLRNTISTHSLPGVDRGAHRIHFTACMCIRRKESRPPTLSSRHERTIPI